MASQLREVDMFMEEVASAEKQYASSTPAKVTTRDLLKRNPEHCVLSHFLIRLNVNKHEDA